MISKRKLLDNMGLRELQVLAAEYEVVSADGRSTQSVREALIESRAPTVADTSEYLRRLSEVRVKEIAASLGIDTTGRKNNLVDRIQAQAQRASDPVAQMSDYEEEFESDELTEDEEELLSHVPDDGSSIGNTRLRETCLGWEEDEYWPVRDSLVEKGFLVVGYGRGGSVYRPPEEADDLPEAETATARLETRATERYPDEESLYPDVETMLRKNWQQLFPGFPAPARHWVDSSPRQGRRETGGRWTRPDLSAITINKYRYVPGTHIDVFTFEVKPHEQFNVIGLYEALGHSRRGNFAYVLYHVPAAVSSEERHARQLDEIVREATRLKVGVATFEDPAEAETWTVHAVPGRHDPEARLLNDFIENLPETIRNEVEFAIRS